jgi:hypothetical protein
MKPKLELIEAVLLVYIKSEIKNVIINHEKHVGTNFEKDILKYCSTYDLYEAISLSLHEFSWAEIRFIFLQYKLDSDSNLKLKLRPITDSKSGTSSEWQAYGRSIPFFTFMVSMKKDAFIGTFEKQLIKFLS